MIIKCKMCGGDIEFTPGATYGTCEYCGSTSTIPKADDESKLNRYNRANHFRRQCEFDKAVAAYEKILEQDDTDAEAHWGAVISRFGIEYVEDPATKKRIPTCHRVQLSSILADEDYKAAVQYAPDAESRRLYEEEAARIAEIQKGILAISQNEKPYDVFICYKETDEAGQRTHDSQWAQEVYYGLTEQGYKVFFSRITLEDKLGQEYEPYIFAALNSAKVMIVIGSKPEYFNAVWVKNEWSRYLALMAQDRKRLLIPCYRGMDPYDLPDELSALQSQDMSKIGFMQDLLRGVKKVLDAEKKPEQPKAAPQAAAAAASADTAAPGIASLMKRAQLFMEDGDFRSAQEYLNRVLDIDPEYASAYAAKAAVAFGLRREADLAGTPFQYEDNPDWQKALRFADPQQKAVYEGYAAKVKERVARQIRDYKYDLAMEMALNPSAIRDKLNAELAVYRTMCTRSIGDRANGNRRVNSRQNEEAFERAVRLNEPGEVSESNLKTAADMFELSGNEGGKARAAQCRTLAEKARQKVIYNKAINLQKQPQKTPAMLEEAAAIFLSVASYKDAVAKAQECKDAGEAIRSRLYDIAVNAMQGAGNESHLWETARGKLAKPELDGYRDVAQLRAKATKRYEECVAAEQEAKRQAEERQRREAEAAAARKKRNVIIAVLTVLLLIAVAFLVKLVIIPWNNYRNAVALQQTGKYEEAITAFEALNGYGDSTIQITETKYLKAKSLAAKGDYAVAAAIFIGIKDYKDVDSLLENDNNLAAVAARYAKYSVGNYVTFGAYPQTATGTDLTAIEWQVLDYDAENNKALLISRYGLDAQPYNTKYTSITWEECTLRTWLNDTFLNKAFTAEEQTGILLTNVDNSSGQGNSKWSTSGGNNTQDKVFLLSYAEAGKYFTDDKARMCAPTDYAVRQGALVNSSNEVNGRAAGRWWMRSPGSSASFAASVNDIGARYFYNVDFGNGCVRPALWINLESGIF